MYPPPGCLPIHVLQIDQLATAILPFGQQNARLLKGLPDGANASPSRCLSGESTPGISPSWNSSRLPPGKTCAEANDDEVLTRCRSRTWFLGESRTTDELGRGGGGPPSEVVDAERAIVTTGDGEYESEARGRDDLILSHRL
jgi:hypothetical protein